MNETEYQAGIRELSKHELINIVTLYRRKLKGCQEFCKDLARENLGSKPIHKIYAAHLESDIDLITNDYKTALFYESKED